jgi:DNA-binding MarR family transcriptional regulator
MSKKIEFKFKTPNESPGYLLGQLTTLWQRRLKKVLDPLNLTQTQFVLMAALGWLARENDNVTQVDIANQGNADRMMVSKVLRTLEDKKFISRQEHQTDTRAKVIKLTNEGAEVLQKALTAVEIADINFFSVLGEKLSLFNHNMVKLTELNKDE